MIKTLKIHKQWLWALFVPLIAIPPLFLQDLLPEKRLDLLTDLPASIFLYDDTWSGGNSRARWLDEPSRQLECMLRTGAEYPFCGTAITLTASYPKGVDLSEYDTLHLQVDYEGPSKVLRFYMRNFNPEYSTINDDDSTQYNYLFVPISSLKKGIPIKLTSFKTADWWLTKYKFTEENLNAGMDNVVSLGLDIPESTSVGRHQIKINAIQAEGAWGSKQNWRILIFSFWIGLVLGSSLLFLLLKRGLHRRSPTCIS